jgi:signal transduction histidine kinase
VDGSSFDGTNIYVEPAAFCAVAARMLAAGGRDSVPAVLTLLGQALSADVALLESGGVRAAIPRPRIRRAAPDVIGLDWPPPIDLPVRARDTVLAVLSIEPSPDGLPAAWMASPGPLGTIADLLALVLGAAADPDADVAAEASQTWLELEEADRADMADELHDGLVQSLVAARYLLDLASTTWPDGPMPWLEAVREGLSAALVDGRALLSGVQPRTRKGRGLRVALEDLCDSYRIPVQLQVTEATSEPYAAPTPVMNAAAYRFVQAALLDLVQRGGDAADLRFAIGPTGMSIDVSAVGDRPAWPDEPGEAMQRWATRIELLGGSVLLQPASAHLRFGPADEDLEPLTQDVHAGRTK